MLKVKIQNGGYIVEGLSQEHVNALSYALETASETGDFYDGTMHFELEKFFGDLYSGEVTEEEEEGDELYSNLLTTTSVRAMDEQDVVIDFTEAFEKDRAAHWETEDDY